MKPDMDGSQGAPGDVDELRGRKVAQSSILFSRSSNSTRLDSA
jgi:hypothetical protein